MYEVNINKKIFDSLGLSKNERLVFDVLITYTMSSSVPKLMKMTGLARSTIRDVLKRLEDRRLVDRISRGKQWAWRYRRGIEKLGKYGEIYRPGNMSNQ